MGGPRAGHQERLASPPGAAAGAAALERRAPCAPTQLAVPGFREKSPSKRASREAFPSQTEWKTFRESVETMLVSQFRKQECFIQRCFEQLSESPVGIGTGAPVESKALESQFRRQESFIQRCIKELAEYPMEASSDTRPPAEISEAWRQSLEASVRRIEALLQDQAVGGQQPASKPCGEDSRLWREHVGESRITSSMDSRITERRCSDASVTSDNSQIFGLGYTEDPVPPDTDVPVGDSGGSASVVCSSSTSREPGSSPSNSRLTKRRDSLKKMNKLKWQIAMQDRQQLQLKRAGSNASLHSIRTAYDTVMYRWLDWWMSLEEPERTGCLSTLIFSKQFETICAAVIIANAFFAAYTTNWEVANLSEEPNAISEWVELSFLSFYFFELVLKFVVHRLFFFCNDDMRWNIFDLFLVVTSVYYQLSMWLMRAGGMDLTYMRTLRVLKLARILRVIRVAKFFSELRLMLNSVLGSFISLFWAFVMLGIVFYVFGLVFVQGTATYLISHGEELDRNSYDKVLKYFGSVQRGMLSLFKATTGGSDWEIMFDSPILERMGALNMGLFIFLIAFIQVALLNILTGVFVENALKLAQPDRAAMALEQRKREIMESNELREFCENLDSDGSGTIDLEEFKQNLQYGKLRAHLQVMGLHVKDEEMFFTMLMEAIDPNEQCLTIEDFVDGCMKMKGSATNLDLQTLMHLLNLQTKGLRQFFMVCDRRFMDLTKRMTELASPARLVPLPQSGEEHSSEDNSHTQPRSGELGSNGLTFYHTF